MAILEPEKLPSRRDLIPSYLNDLFVPFLDRNRSDDRSAISLPFCIVAEYVGAVNLLLRRTLFFIERKPGPRRSRSILPDG